MPSHRSTHNKPDPASPTSKLLISAAIDDDNDEFVTQRIFCRHARFTLAYLLVSLLSRYRLKDRAYVTRDIKTPDPVPEEGQQAALELMKTGKMYRYNIAKGEESVVSMCEQEIADYTGFKYCVGLNSCGSALMLLLKTTGLQPGGKVLSNAFTFGAVPSAIEHANGKAVY